MIQNVSAIVAKLRRSRCLEQFGDWEADAYHIQHHEPAAEEVEKLAHCRPRMVLAKVVLTCASEAWVMVSSTAFAGPFREGMEKKRARLVQEYSALAKAVAKVMVMAH